MALVGGQRPMNTKSGEGLNSKEGHVVGLGVKEGALGVVGDADFHVLQAGEPLHRRGIGGAHTGGGDHPDRDAARAQLLESRDEQAQTRPLDERDQDFDLVGGSHLRRPHEDDVRNGVRHAVTPIFSAVVTS